MVQEHLHETQLRLDSADFRSQQYISQNIVRWTERTVLDSVIAFAKAAGVPDRYIQSLSVVQTGYTSAEVVLDYQGPKGEPLGLWFEKGTKAHIIRARIADLLRWVDKRTGKVRFAKWVRHPGTKPLRIMELGAKSGIPRLENMIASETSKFMWESRIP